MKCSKCGYDYPARETKCPYCGEPNKLGMEWEKEEDETRKETLLTKAKVLHSMPLYVANKIMNIILLLAVVLLVVLFLVFFILGYVDEKHTEHQKRSASVEAAEEIFKTGDNAALDAYLHEYEVYAEDGYEKYTERVDIYDRYSHFIEDVMDLRRSQTGKVTKRQGHMKWKISYTMRMKFCFRMIIVSVKLNFRKTRNISVKSSRIRLQH